MPQFLKGALAIGRKLVELGVLQPTDDDTKLEDKVYGLDRSGRMRFDRFGHEYISTPEKLQKEANKIVS
jgi:hypothetical protein